MNASKKRKSKKVELPTARTPAHSALRWRVPGLCLALAAITFAVFGQTLHHEFVDFDDNQYVYENPVVTGGLTLKGIVWEFTHFDSANWHPLTWLSHMLDCQLYGLNPGGHHLTNVLLHTVTVILLFLVLRQMTGALWRSAFVAAVFAIHPLRVESVAWVAKRKDVLSGLFFMLTLGAYVRYARKVWSWGNYGLVLLLFTLGLMCKPMLVTLPLVLLVLDYWPLERIYDLRLAIDESKDLKSGPQIKAPSAPLVLPDGRISYIVYRKLLLEKVPFFLLAAAGCGATLLAQNKAMFSFSALPLSLCLANALGTCLIYLGQMVWPAGLSVFYPLSTHVIPWLELVMAGALLAVFLAVALWQRHKQPWLLAGWLWYLVMLLPVLGVIQVGSQAHADRYTYLPQIGIYMAVTWLLAEWGAKWQVRPAAMGCVAAGITGVLMICAWNQTAYWKNSEILWSHALTCNPRNEVAHFNLGGALFKMGRTDEAIDQFQQALESEPGRADPHVNLGVALLQKGKVDEAIGHFQKALDLDANCAEARYGLGNTFSREGRMAEAIDQFQKALQIKPAYPEALNNLAWLLSLCPDASLRDGKKALELVRQANDLTGGANPIVLQTLAAAFAEVGRFDDAVQCVQKAIAVAPAAGRQDLESQLNIALKRFQAGLPYQE